MTINALVLFIDFIEGKVDSLPFVCSYELYEGVLDTLTDNKALRDQLKLTVDLIFEYDRLVFIRERLRTSRKGRMQSHTIDEVNEQIYTLIPKKDQALKNYEMMRRLWAFDIEALKLKG